MEADVAVVNDADSPVILNCEYSKFIRNSMTNVRRSSLFPVERGSIYPADFSLGVIQETGYQQETTTPLSSDDDEAHDINAKPTGVNSKAGYLKDPKHRNSAAKLAVIKIKQQRRNRIQKRHIVANCLRVGFRFFYYAGLSSIQPKPLQKTFVWIQKIYMWSILSVSLLYTISSAKTNWIYFRADPTKLQFLYFGVCMVAFTTRLYYIKVFACRTKSTKNMLKRIDQLNNQRDDNHGSNEDSKTQMKIFTTLAALVTISILMSASMVVFGKVPFKRWSFQTQQLLQAYETSELVLIWSSQNLENETDVLDEKYGTNMTAAAASLAVTGDIITFVGSLHENLMIDFWALMAIQLYQMHQSLHGVFNDLDDSDHLDTDEWNLYLKQREVCDAINEIYGKLLVFVHIQNTILISYTLLTIFNKAAISAYFVVRIVNVGKILLTYNYFQKASDTNTVLKEAILRKSKRRQEIFVDGNNLSVSVLLEDIRSHPIGLGRGEYHVNDAFIAKMLGAAASIFIVLMDALK